MKVSVKTSSTSILATRSWPDLNLRAGVKVHVKTSSTSILAILSCPALAT